ncbi:MAG: hypothetical protein IPN89_01480 [Saprospiraceae bacterium]|nr:hypothetical protein [Saprospiraceae bacterium]
MFTKYKVNLLSTILCFFFLIGAAHSQSFWFGLKGGAAMNLQNWGDGASGVSTNRNPLFTINGDVFIESVDEQKKGSLYAQLGFHTRGSALRYFSINNAFSDVIGYKFRNVVLELGAKKSLNLDKEYDPYFILGIRGEYTVGSNLSDLITFNTLVYPEFIRKFNYGVTVGGGFETEMSEMSNVFLEFSIQPDLSFQYEQLPLYGIRTPWPPNDRINLGLTQVRNVSIEVKAGVRFLRKVVYID